MRTPIVIFAFLSLLGLAGCAEQARERVTPVALKALILHDFQGLFGGQALWVAEDRTAFIQIVGQPPKGKAGLWEKRYKTRLTAEQWAQTERLVGAHDLLTHKVPERLGIPDEAHPAIAVITKVGSGASAWKWASDKDPDFDPLYRHLLGLCRGQGELVREGIFERDWCPDGFAVPWK